MENKKFAVTNCNGKLAFLQGEELIGVINNPDDMAMGRTSPQKVFYANGQFLPAFADRYLLPGTYIFKIKDTRDKGEEYAYNVVYPISRVSDERPVKCLAEQIRQLAVRLAYFNSRGQIPDAIVEQCISLATKLGIDAPSIEGSNNTEVMDLFENCFQEFIESEENTTIVW